MPSRNVTIQDTSPLIQYGSGWSDVLPSFNPQNFSGYDGPSCHSTSGEASVNAFRLNHFYASSVYVYGTITSDVEFVAVTYSAGSPFPILNDTVTATALSNTTNSTLLYQQQRFYSSRPHDLAITVTKGKRFSLDYVILEYSYGNEDATSSSHDIYLNSSSPAFSYDPGPAGQWRTDLMPGEHSTSTVGSAVNIDFRGSSIEVYGTTFTNTSFDYTCDGEQFGKGVGSTDVQSYATQSKQLLCVCNNMEEGLHRVRLVNDGPVRSSYRR
ncbi:hypothetical protein K474DRAFT_1333078 [Panus rudis PR-1116 ss-1]|nr:hypothetical protein K474DRAFT_1333078 [Panus rudis PR-1116 ss-1]